MKRLLILQFWLFLIFCSYLSLTPAPPDALRTYSDKFLHLAGYCALYLSCYLAYYKQMTWYKIAVFLLSFSFVIEIAQHFIPHRGFALGDMLANASGLFLGYVLTKVAETTGLFEV